MQVALEQPDLILLTGDISGDGSAASYQHFCQLWQQAQIKAPLRVIAGNHDKMALLHQYLSAQLLDVADPMPLGNWVMHGLNSQYQGALGHISVASLQQLQWHLAQQPEHYHLLALHHHPLALNGWMDQHALLNADALNQVIQSHQQVRAVVYGHVHMQREVIQHDCLYLACPSTCWQWQNAADFAVSELTAGFRVLQLRDNGSMASHICRL